MPFHNGIHKFIIYFCETKIKGIKKTVKILSITVAVLNIFFATVPILLKFSRVQNFIVQTVVGELSDKLHTKVTLGKIDYHLFNSISINNLYVEDLHHDTLVYSKNTKARFSFWKIFRGHIHITSIELNQFHGNLVIDTHGHTNIDFIIKAFAPTEKRDTTHVDYQIKRFEIKNSSFNYTDQRQKSVLPPHVFNSAKLKLSNINAEIALHVLKEDTLSAEILHLNAVEQSGLILTDLSTKITGSHNQANIPLFTAKLPHSQLNIGPVSLKYDSLPDFEKFMSKVKIDAPVQLSQVSLADLSAIVPEFKYVKGFATFSGQISGRISSLRLKNMELKYGKGLLLNADLDINGLPNIYDAFIYGKINELHVEKNGLQDLISELTRKPFILPKELNKLGVVRYRGNITGFLSNLVAFGNLYTDLGNISTDILIQLENHLQDVKYNGTIKSENIQLGSLLNSKDIGNVSFSLNTKGIKKQNKALQGTIDAKVNELQFKKYSYRDIQFNGKYDGKGFDGKIDVQDENINAHFIGIVDLTQKLPIFDFNLKVAELNLNALKLTEKYPGATLSFDGKTNMTGNSPDNINGTISFENIRFMNKDKTLNVDKIQFISRTENNLTHFIINSDYVNGSLDGNFKYSTIGKTINRLIYNYLPSLADNSSGKNTEIQNNINIDLKIDKTNDLAKALELPYEIDGISSIKGFIDDKTNRVNLEANIPVIKSNKLYLENFSLLCENKKNQLKLTSRAQLHEKDEVLSFYILSTAAKDSIATQLGWQNSKQITNAGELLTVTKFRKEGNVTATNLMILPTQIIIDDSIWNIHRCKIDFKPDSTIQIHNFKFEHNNQFIHIDGVASINQKDSIGVQMNKLDLGFIFDLLKLKSISIGGIATGKATLRSILQEPIFEADIKVKDVTLNHKLMADATLHSTWNKENKWVDATGIFINNQNDTVAIANGKFIPKTDSLNFVFDARKIPLDFLDPYFESVAQNFSGFGSGKITMLGPSKILGFEGDAFVTKGHALIKMLKTNYFFNDSIHLTRKTIKFDNITIYDDERNHGVMSGLMTHNGIFKEMQYNVNLRSDNILALDTHAEDNDYFFGKAYANGTVRIYGDEKEANINVNAVSQPKTKCYIQMGGASKASNNGFITFINKDKPKNDKVHPVEKPSETAFNVKVDLQIEVAPNADMELIVDPKGGDKITGRGEGNLRVVFDTFSDIKLYGTYAINNGYYLFTMQNLFRKEFKIDQGSSINWTGNPYNAQVSIRAIYPVTVPLKDLATTQLNENMRSTVPVNCVLNLSDNLMKPTIKFDLDLPQSDEGVKQLVKNIVNTDEMMNRQILYLLVFNKFYTPDYMRTATTNTNIATNEGFSFLTSTVSAQVNNWLSQMVNNVSVGFDYQQSTETNYGGEYQAQVLYQPNNRLIINGNLGYRTDNLTTSTSRFVGDVDLEYLLTESGKLRFKAYNHTIDRYYLGTSKLSQGIGFVYKEDFATVDDLFKYYWHLLSGTKKNKKDEPATQPK
jgi:hypothetical protein